MTTGHEPTGERHSILSDSLSRRSSLVASSVGTAGATLAPGGATAAAAPAAAAAGLVNARTYAFFDRQLNPGT